MSNRKNKIQRFFGFLPILAKYVFCVYATFTLLTCVFLMPFLGHPLQRSYININYIFLSAALLLCATYLLIKTIITKRSLLIKKFTQNKEKDHVKRFFIIATIILFVLQMIVVYGKLFIAGWDVARIYFTTPIQDYYFSIYPNNLFMKGIISASTNIISAIPGLTDLFINKVTNTFSGNEVLKNLNNQTAAECINYVIFVVINCILVNISVLLSSLICKNHISYKTALIEYIICAIFVGLMPWILVPYSDTIALFFTTLIIYAYMNINNKNIKYSIVIFAAIIGFNIKPTVIFAVLAIALTELCMYIYNYKKRLMLKGKEIVKPIICVFVTTVISFGIVAFTKSIPKIDIDKNKEYTSTHYLMMGAHPYTGGFYTYEDVNFSDSFQNVEDREKGNIEVWKQRVSSLGVKGVTELMLRKNMCNYADGSFMWAMDAGPKFSMIDIGKNEIINWIYDNYYYIAQIVWFSILIGSVLTIFIKQKNKFLNMMSLTLLMLSAFLMVFECGARYLILYLPYFIIMSSFGWSNLSAIMQGKLIKNK